MYWHYTPTRRTRSYGRVVDNRDEVREFLTSRRAKITPEQAALPAGTRRRVTGLRRSEVATPADVGVEYYAKLERGNLAGVSPAVLEAIARALRLDDAERAHLLHLAQAQSGPDTLARPRRRSGRQRTSHKGLQRTLDAVTAGPAFVVNGRLDVLAANQLARAFFADMYDSDTQPPNLARHQFLDTAARRFHPDWDRTGAPDDLTAGHRTQVWLATQHAVTPSTGGYWYHRQTRTPHPAARDEKFQARLLQALESHTGVPLD